MKPSRRVNSKSMRWAFVISGYGILVSVRFSTARVAAVQRKLSSWRVLSVAGDDQARHLGVERDEGIVEGVGRALEDPGRRAGPDHDAIDEWLRREVDVDSPGPSGTPRSPSPETSAERTPLPVAVVMTSPGSVRGSVGVESALSTNVAAVVPQ